MPALETFPLRDYDHIAKYDEVCRKRFGRTYDLESIVQQFGELREPDCPLTARHVFALFNPHPEDFAVYSPPILNLLQLPAQPVEDYLAYCDELRVWGAHFGVTGVAKTDQALWVFMSGRTGRSACRWSCVRGTGTR